MLMMPVSPHLLAIQSIKGKKSGEKYKELHKIAIKIIENVTEKEKFLSTGKTDLIQPSLYPYTRIIIGNKLKLNELVIEALKSDDITIVKQALKAKWFFKSFNININVDNFIINIIPYISLHTRFALIKVLARCLVQDSSKADNFFSTFVDLYGVQQSLPLITACSEEHIYNKIIKHRINLPIKILTVLYRKHPKLVVKYLQLGNKRNKENQTDREKFEITLNDYKEFLPTLIKNYTEEFVELFKCLSNYKSILLKTAEANIFLKNAKDVLINDPKIFLDILPLENVIEELTLQQFETMIINLFPNNFNAVNLNKIMYYLKYYPKEKTFKLINETSVSLYNKQIIEDEYFYNCIDFVKVVPTDIINKYVSKEIETNPDEENAIVHLLPAEKSIVRIKEILKDYTSFPGDWIRKMILSCYYHEDKNALLEVLNINNEYNKSNHNSILWEIVDKFDVKTLDAQHWHKLKKLIEKVYMEGNLFEESNVLFSKLLSGAFHYYLKFNKLYQENENKWFLYLLTDIILKGLLQESKQWNFIVDCPEIGKDCLQILLTIIPQKYSETHSFWNDENNKQRITKYLIQSMQQFNNRNLKEKYNNDIRNADEETNEIKAKMFTIKDYSWLKNFAIDVLKTQNFEEDEDFYSEYRTILKEHDFELYQKLIDNDSHLIYDVRSNEILSILKCNSNKILAKWNLYLNVCRKQLKHNNENTKLFLRKIKWFEEIPMKFVEQCLIEIKEEGSILVLGLLLDGKEFYKIIESHLSKNRLLDPTDEDTDRYLYPLLIDFNENLSKAINFTNPVIYFDTVVSLCDDDFVQLIIQTLANVAQRTSVEKILNFIRHSQGKNKYVKKLIIRLASQVMSRCEFYKFLEQIWTEESTFLIREIIARTILDTFMCNPNENTWKLMKHCIQGLNNYHERIFKFLLKFDIINKNYISLYVKELLKKIESEKNLSNQYIQKLLCRITDIEHDFPKDLILNILKKYYCLYSSLRSSMETYLFDEPSEFNERLESFLLILEDRIKDVTYKDPLSIECRPRRKFNIRKTLLSFLKNFLKNEKSDVYTLVVNKILELFLKLLHPWQDPEIYIALLIHKNYHETKTPKEFGIQCGESNILIIKELGSDIFFNKVIWVIKKILENSKIYNENWEDVEIMVAKGLMECSDKRLGALMGIDIAWKGDNYEKIESLIEIWKTIDDISVKMNLPEKPEVSEQVFIYKYLPRSNYLGFYYLHCTCD